MDHHTQHRLDALARHVASTTAEPEAHPAHAAGDEPWRALNPEAKIAAGLLEETKHGTD